MGNKRHKRVVLVGGFSLYGIYPLLAVVELGTLHNALSRPASVKGDKIVAVVVKVNAHGQNSLYVERSFTRIFQTDASCDDVQLIKYCVKQHRFKSRVLVYTSDLKRFSFVFIRKRRRKSIQSGFALVHLM